MESGYFPDFLANPSLAMVIGGAGLLVALLALLSLARSSRQATERHETIKQRVDTLWRELDDLRVDQFNGKGISPSSTGAPLAEQFTTEKAAYEQVWPEVWLLHDKLGMFLRSTEAGEATREQRLDTRHAALNARSTLNQLRPFCHGEVEELVTRLIDAEINAHLAACKYMDLMKESAVVDNRHERGVQREKFRVIYDGEARELITQLVASIRRRTIRPDRD